MIELTRDQLIFSFPEIHPDARLHIECQRTLRMPAGEPGMPALPGLGRYPLFDLEDYSDRVPERWRASGGGLLPMYQSEAMWLSFRPVYSVAHMACYPFAVKLAVGGTDALTGLRWKEGLHQWPQDYLAINDPSWLGGFRTDRGVVRQFVAMPLGGEYFAGGAVADPNRFGRIELIVYPMRRRAFSLRYPAGDARRRRDRAVSAGSPQGLGTSRRSPAPSELRLGEIEQGLFPLEDWHPKAPARIVLHLANSLHWCAITGSPPPMAPLRSAARRRRQAEALDAHPPGTG